MPPSPRQSHRVTKLLFPLVLAALLLIAFFSRDSIYDWWRLRGYSAPKAISHLATHDTMTASAKHIYYVNHPQLVTDKTTFRADCVQTEQTIVLGCYRPLERGIYIFNVTDSRLSGVEEVTAAHEMLHAAYDRLSPSDKTRVDGWLNDYYHNDLKDQRILKTIASYKKTEPKDIVNEMHSIFGTEVKNLPANLENYYKRYFTDREKVVSYSNQYQAAFTSRENQAKALYDQLQTLANQIQTMENGLTTTRTSLDADRGSIGSQAEADAFNKRVRDYNSQVSQLDSMVSQYNTLRDQYNALVVQEQSLIKSIDTRSVQPAQAK